MQPTGLYIHFPFCIKKCNYCDFLSFPMNDMKNPQDLLSSYIESLKNEIIYRSQFFKDTPITSIFFGGGTPSLMSAKHFEEIMDILHRYYHIEATAEITSEANPGTLSAEKLSAMRKSGINRLSIGLQSTNDCELKCLGRIHTWQQFLDNYENARAVGFENINIDLMSALPNQSVESYTETLDQVMALKPEHISAYSLIIEEGTPFFDAEDSLHLPSEDDERKMYALTKEVLAKNGYQQYEISNYAHPGYECRHNIIYWTRGNYLGLGLGASSLIDNLRFSNERDLQTYMNLWTSSDDTAEFLKGTAVHEKLDVSAQMEEFMFLGLRMTNGISVTEFETYFNCPISKPYGAVIDKHLKDGTLKQVADRLLLTQKGLDVSNYVMSDFIF